MCSLLRAEDVKLLRTRLKLLGQIGVCVSDKHCVSTCSLCYKLRTRCELSVTTVGSSSIPAARMIGHGIKSSEHSIHGAKYSPPGLAAPSPDHSGPSKSQPAPMPPALLSYNGTPARSPHWVAANIRARLRRSDLLQCPIVSAVFVSAVLASAVSGAYVPISRWH